MSTSISSLIPHLLVCLSGGILCVFTQFQAHAAGGDIIISRDVQPRSATRQELVPDPHPRRVNPNRAARINSTLKSGQAPLEMSDREFASVTSGTSLGNGLQVFTPALDQAGNPMSSRVGLGVQGNSAAGRSVGGAAGRIGGDVNRSVQQGLRPLQSLGK